MMNAVSVETPNPRVRNPGIQCCQVSSRIAMTTPATALSMKAGPTTVWSLNPSKNSLRCTYAETSTATAAMTRNSFMADFPSSTSGLGRRDLQEEHVIGAFVVHLVPHVPRHEVSQTGS